MGKYLCSENLHHSIEENLQSFTTLSLDAGNCRQAAVAITVVDYRHEGGLNGLNYADKRSGAVLLTRRSARLRNHAGQWAFPGGGIDEGERPEQTALRELEEEVGLKLPPDRVLGFLDDFVTRSGFHIVPVVIWGGEVEGLQKNSEEVASLHRIPCAELFRSDSPLLEPANHSSGLVLYMPVGDTCIATPTAAMLYQFREVALGGRSTRVSHYDQPFFAWR